MNPYSEIEIDLELGAPWDNRRNQLFESFLFFCPTSDDVEALRAETAEVIREFGDRRARWKGFSLFSRSISELVFL